MPKPVITPTGVKLGSKGKVADTIVEIYRALTKGEARQLRKQLRAQGKARLAVVSR